MKTIANTNALRKAIALIALCLTVTVATAQIQTKFFGCTLGQSTKANVIANLKARRIVYSVQPNGIVLFTKAKFGGYTWEPGGCFSFYDNKFYEIAFFMSESLEDNYNVDTNPRTRMFFNNLVDTFDEKYILYKLYSSSDANQSVYRDETTHVSIKFNDKTQYEKSVSLTYTNRHLFTLKSEADKGEF